MQGQKNIKWERHYICIQDLHFEKDKSLQNVLWRKSLNVKDQAERYRCHCALRQGTNAVLGLPSFIVT